MSGIGRDEVLHVAKLASLEVPEAELPQLVEKLQRIVAMVEQLAEVTVAGKPPTFNVGPERAELRADVVSPETLAHPLSAMAPGFAGEFFTVPRHTAMEES